MNHIFTFYFKGSDMRSLINANTGYVLVKSEIVVRPINGQNVGVIQVSASSYRRSTSPGVDPTLEATISGCPVPPCVPTNGIIYANCEDDVENLLQFYVKNLLS